MKCSSVMIKWKDNTTEEILDVEVTDSLGREGCVTFERDIFGWNVNFNEVKYIVIMRDSSEQTKNYYDGDECPKCHQKEYHSGEYPCDVCGRPTTWDDEE